MRQLIARCSNGLTRNSTPAPESIKEGRTQKIAQGEHTGDVWKSLGKLNTYPPQLKNKAENTYWDKREVWKGYRNTDISSSLKEEQKLAKGNFCLF